MKKMSESLGIFGKIAVLTAALSIEVSEARNTRQQVKEVLEAKSEHPSSIITTEPSPSWEAKAEEAEFILPNEIIAEDGVKPTVVEAAKEFPGYKFIGKFEGNGGREALIYIPEGLNPDQPAEMVYHFHGTNGELIDEVYPPLQGANARYNRWVKEKKLAVGGNRLRQVLSEALEGQKEGRNYVVVYPLSSGQRGPSGSAAERNGYDAYWMQKGNSTKDDMAKFDLQIKETLTQKMRLPDLKIKKTTIKGHSAGGQPLKNIAVSGFAVDRIDYLDADYGWAKTAYQAAIKNNPATEMNLVTILGSETSRYSLPMKGKKGVEVIAVFDEVKTKNKIGEKYKSEKGFLVMNDKMIPHAEMNQNFFNWQRSEKK